MFSSDVCTVGLGLTVALAAIAFAISYFHVKRFRANHYWRLKSVPCDDPLPVLGNFFSFIRGKPFFVMDHDMYRRHGRIFGGYSGPTPTLFVAEPELVRKILVKDFHAFVNRRDVPTQNKVVASFVNVLQGEDWHRVRSVVTPAFSTGKLKKMMKLILECGESARRNFQKYAESGEYVDCRRVFGGFTLDVIASAAFGTKLNSHEDPENIFVQKAKLLFYRGFSWTVLFYFICPKLIKLLGINVYNDEVVDFFGSLSSSIVERRRKNNEVRDDFLNNLMEAQKNSLETTDKSQNEDSKGSMHKPLVEDEEATDEIDSGSYFKNYQKNKTMSETELVAQCVIFFLAGYETTATTISMVAYYLARNPKCQERLIQEVDAVWKKHIVIDADALRVMKYVDAVISETLRLAPPAGRLDRRANEDYPLGDTGITIPKDMIVTIPVYSMHRDPEFFPEPEVFNPDRFLPENKDLIQPYTFMPFGSGPRNCLGMRMALMEVKLGLLQVFKDFTFDVCPATKIPLKILPGSGLYSPTDITLKVTRRNKFTQEN